MKFHLDHLCLKKEFSRTGHKMGELKEQCGISQSCLSLPQMHGAIKPSMYLQSENHIHSTQTLKPNRRPSNKSKLFVSKLKDHSRALLDLKFPADGYISDDFNRIENGYMFEKFGRIQDNSTSKCDKEIDVYATNSMDEVGCSNYSYVEKARDAESTFNHAHGEIHDWPDENSTLAIQPYCNDHPYLDFNNSELTSSLFGRLPSFSSFKERPEIEYIPIVIQALPCFPASYRLKTQNRKPKISKNQEKLLAENPNMTAVKKFKIRIKKPNHSKNSTYDEPDMDSSAADILVHMLKSNIENSSCDSLNWLVNAISSELPNNDYDLFENVTLKLVETKQDKCNIVKPSLSLNGKQNKSVSTKCEKHAKKFRRKKNFQKEVLPSIVRLSRKEVKEDFCEFERLMRSVGETFNAKVLNENRKKKKNVGFKKREKRLIGWGKKTGRCPRTRVKLGNITLVF